MVISECCYDFPDPEETADENGLFAIGGDLNPDTLIYAYSHGFFPWGDEPVIKWYCPPWRPVLLCRQDLHLSHSLKKVLKCNDFQVRADTNFQQVIRYCRELRREKTWLTETMLAAYVRLHELQIAHSVEVYREGQLVGGLYGIALGRMFCGESMFHLLPDMSKVALVALHSFLRQQNFLFIDVQQMTPLMRAMGAQELERKRFLQYVEEAVRVPGLQGSWQGIFSFPVVVAKENNRQ